MTVIVCRMRERERAERRNNDAQRESGRGRRTFFCFDNTQGLQLREKASVFRLNGGFSSSWSLLSFPFDILACVFRTATAMSAAFDRPPLLINSIILKCARGDEHFNISAEIQTPNDR
jgi:hypothetical protein